MTKNQQIKQFFAKKLEKGPQFVILRDLTLSFSLSQSKLSKIVNELISEGFILRTKVKTEYGFRFKYQLKIDKKGSVC